MRWLGSSTGVAERQLRLLSQLTEAIINLEAAALAKSRDFSLTNNWADDLRRLYAY
jgi:hypothetical protein